MRNKERLFSRGDPKIPACFVDQNDVTSLYFLIFPQIRFDCVAFSLWLVAGYCSTGLD